MIKNHWAVIIIIFIWKQWEWCEFDVVDDNTSLAVVDNDDDDDDDITWLTSRQHTLSRDI